MRTFPLLLLLVSATFPYAHAELDNKPQVFYVENDPDIQDLVTQVVAEQAHLTIAPTYKEAKRQLASNCFDLMLLDVALPDGNGLDLLADIEACPTKPQVVVFSANPV